jgi:S1-C subfamily serine protease
MKKFFCGLICGMIIMLSISGYAITQITAQYNSVKVTVDGTQVNTQVVAVTEQGQVNGRNYTSAADVARAMGGTAEWNGTTKTVEIETPRTDLQKVVKDCKDSCVMVYSYKGTKAVMQGSGWVFQGNVVTAKHVVENADRYVIYTDDSVYGITSREAYLDPTLDVAVIKANLDLPSVVLGDSDKLIEGEKLVAITSPKGAQNIVDECLNSGTQTTENGHQLYLSEVEMNGGSSGGAVLNGKSEIVGIITNGDTVLNSAIPINDIKPILEKY